MKLQMIGFISVMLSMILLIVFYMTHKLNQILRCYGIIVKKLYLYIITGIVGFIIVITRSAFAAMVLYMFMMFILVDVLKIILLKADKKRILLTPLVKIYCHGMLIVGIGLLIALYSVYIAKNPHVTEYQVTIDKHMEDDINIVLLSDIHAGTAVKEHQFDIMLDKVNELDADIICLAGDIFDESSDKQIIRYACDTFSRMHSVYGVYYITGNHDKGIMEDFEELLLAAGVKIIDDSAVFIDNRFYLVGRTDLGMEGEKERTSMEQLLEQVDASYPVILLDHRPTALEEARGTCVDLQLSGHTHAGQIFPGNIIVDIFNDVGYGFKNYHGLNVIVSSGYGTWGFPIRVGSHSEIVNVILQGKQ